MALPTSRDFNAIDGGPLPHTTVNNLQDAIVDRTHGEIQVVQTGWEVQGMTDRGISSGEYWEKDNGFACKGMSSPSTEQVVGWFSIDLAIGTAIRQIDVNLFTDTGIAGRLLVIEMHTVADVTLGVSATAVSTGGWGTDTSVDVATVVDLLTIGGTDLVQTATNLFTLRVLCASNIRIGTVVWTIAKPT